jgi:transcriptional regulator with XRE-family HTH domain
MPLRNPKKCPSGRAILRVRGRSRDLLVEKLQAVKDANGWTFEKLAWRFGFSARTLGRWLTGRAKPWPRHRARLRRILARFKV